MGCGASRQVGNEPVKTLVVDPPETERTESWELTEDEYNLAGYVFEREIGRGSSAIAVQMSKDGRSYAVKVCDLINAKLNFMQISTRDPKEEAAILRRFDHPHVVKLFDFIEDTDNDKVFIVMELLSGGTLMSCDPDDIQDAFSQALSAVHYIHFQRIAHRDIKTENIMRHEDGTIRLVDFGLALFVPEEVSEVKVETVGTPAYFAPELFTQSTYDPFAADIWALGVSLYSVLFKNLPFTADNMFDLQRKIIEEEPPFPDDADPNAVDLIKRMLAKSPHDRITTDEIWSHQYLNSTKSSTQKQILKSDSQIFKFLSSSDRQNSIVRISRGSRRGSRQNSAGASGRRPGT